MGVKLGLSHQGKSVDSENLRPGCSGKYLGLRITKKQEEGKKCMKGSTFVIVIEYYDG
jgi:hypothetical protein